MVKSPRDNSQHGPAASLSDTLRRYKAVAEMDPPRYDTYAKFRDMNEARVARAHQRSAGSARKPALPKAKDKDVDLINAKSSGSDSLRIRMS